MGGTCKLKSSCRETDFVSAVEAVLEDQLHMHICAIKDISRRMRDLVEFIIADIWPLAYGWVFLVDPLVKP